MGSAVAVPGSEILMNVPMFKFSLPVFATDGNKTWEVCGSSVTMVGNGIFHVKDAVLLCFATDGVSGEIFHATSDSAVVMSQNHAASGGESPIKIVGKNFDAYANAWEFFGNSKKIVAKNNVKVFIRESIGNFSP
jgi:hypothetical protein